MAFQFGDTAWCYQHFSQPDQYPTRRSRRLFGGRQKQCRQCDEFSGHVDGLVAAGHRNPTAVLGEPLLLSVVAKGTPPLAYRWFKNGVAMANGTNSDLSFTNAQTTNAGNYYIKVTNSVGSVTSITASVVVEIGRPIITAQHSGTNLTLNWPLWGTNFALHSAASPTSSFTA